MIDVSPLRCTENRITLTCISRVSVNRIRKSAPPQCFMSKLQRVKRFLGSVGNYTVVRSEEDQVFLSPRFRDRSFMKPQQ